MADGRVPVFRAIKLAYRDVYRVFAAMPRLVGIVFFILLAFSAIQATVSKSTLELPQVAVALSVVNAFLLTPYIIAVHRYILIDEVTHEYAFAPQEPRFLRFFAWSAVLSVISIGFTLTRGLLLFVGLPAGIAFVGAAVASVIGIFIATRLIILFPAIAVEAPGATASNAFADTKGYFWNIFVLVILALLPLLLLVAPLASLNRPLPLGAHSGLSLQVTSIIALTIMSMVTVPLFVAIASRLFQALAERVMGRAAA